MEKYWVRMEYDILRASGMVGRDGEIFPLSSSDKLVYVYVRERVKYFVQERGGEYYASQESIGEALSLHPKTVGKSVRKFCDAGVFVVHKEKDTQGWPSSSYKHVKEMNLVFGKTSKTKEKGRKPDTHAPSDYDEYDDPF